MKSTPVTTLAKKPGMSRVKLAMQVRPTGPLVKVYITVSLNTDLKTARFTGR